MKKYKKPFLTGNKETKRYHFQWLLHQHPRAIPTCTILKKEQPHKAYSACLNKQRLSL